MILSIIIPVYNVEKVLSRCVESILNQTFKYFELILVDDGSQDNSNNICDYYAKLDCRVRVIHKENGGASSARNSGLKVASGRYIQFVDADDYLEPNMCGVLINNIEINKSDLVICGLRIISNNKKILLPSLKIPYLNLHEGYKEFIELYSKDLLNSPCNKLYKRDKINTTFVDDLSLGEDLIFNLSYLKGVEAITCIPDILYNYVYDNSDSLTKKVRINIIDIMLLLDAQINDFYIYRFGWNNDIAKLYSFFIRDLFNALQRVIIESDISKKNKLIIIKDVIYNERVKLSTANYGQMDFQVKLFHTLLKTKNKYIVYYLFMIKKVALILFKRKW
jgi:glycosyltransferase involved in cell wall biosynthesis